MAHPLGHFKTITKHRHKVIRHCFKAGIFWQGLRHDLSKYSPTEFIPGAKFYLGTRSPNEKEREVYGYSMAWMHHKGRNKHHYEYWIDYSASDIKGGMAPARMPEKYVVEMLMDRIAACKTYHGSRYTDGDPLAYFSKGKANAMMHPETKALLEKLLTMLAQKGEKETFSYIRKEIFHKKR